MPFFPQNFSFSIYSNQSPLQLTVIFSLFFPLLFLFWLTPALSYAFSMLLPLFFESIFFFILHLTIFEAFIPRFFSFQVQLFSFFLLLSFIFLICSFLRALFLYQILEYEAIPSVINNLQAPHRKNTFLMFQQQYLVSITTVHTYLEKF